MAKTVTITLSPAEAKQFKAFKKDAEQQKKLAERWKKEDEYGAHFEKITNTLYKAVDRISQYGEDLADLSGVPDYPRDARAALKQSRKLIEQISEKLTVATKVLNDYQAIIEQLEKEEKN